MNKHTLSALALITLTCVSFQALQGSILDYAKAAGSACLHPLPLTSGISAAAATIAMVGGLPAGVGIGAITTGVTAATQKIIAGVTEATKRINGACSALRGQPAPAPTRVQLPAPAAATQTPAASSMKKSDEQLDGGILKSAKGIFRWGSNKIKSAGQTVWFNKDKDKVHTYDPNSTEAGRFAWSTIQRNLSEFSNNHSPITVVPGGLAGAGIGYGLAHLYNKVIKPGSDETHAIGMHACNGLFGACLSMLGGGLISAASQKLYDSNSKDTTPIVYAGAATALPCALAMYLYTRLHYLKSKNQPRSATQRRYHSYHRNRSW